MALFIGRTGQMTGVLPFSRMKGYGGQGFAVSPVWALLIHRSLFPEMLAGHSLHGAARRLHAARPRSRGHAHRAAGGKARRPGPTSRQSCARTQQSRLGRAARRRQSALYPARQPRQPLQADQSLPHGGADADVRGMGRKDSRPHGDRSSQIPKPTPSASSPAKNRSAPGSTPSAAPTRGRSPRNWPSRASHRPTSTNCAASSARRSAASRSSISPATCAPPAPPKPSSTPLPASSTSSAPSRTTPTWTAPDSRGRRARRPRRHAADAALAHGNVEIERDYEPDLPRINAYGGELNQVWTALIENALDALGNHGKSARDLQARGRHDARGDLGYRPRHSARSCRSASSSPSSPPRRLAKAWASDSTTPCASCASTAAI